METLCFFDYIVGHFDDDASHDCAGEGDTANEVSQQFREVIETIQSQHHSIASPLAEEFEKCLGTIELPSSTESARIPQDIIGPWNWTRSVACHALDEAIHTEFKGDDLECSLPNCLQKDFCRVAWTSGHGHFGPAISFLKFFCRGSSSRKWTAMKINKHRMHHFTDSWPNVISFQAPHIYRWLHGKETKLHNVETTDICFATRLMHITDWLPTLVKLAGGKVTDDIDGINQKKMITRGAGSKRTNMVYHLNREHHMFAAWFGEIAVRNERFKLIWGTPGSTDGYGEGMDFIFNLPYYQELLSSNNNRKKRGGPYDERTAKQFEQASEVFDLLNVF
ncbi:hypothetical protein CAPTEDRAFT_199594 [Capitella teleta]|uniref:Uncharacterized protein n=1 Tax=Capitella teleta TaxID=283909 RepID=R7UFR6_CAPTE|nr:hypothetical protein CAPTEDRAFT_199594 [Capitella teleta]|eukprot:ELU05040.1 hypothetical protein CAPTEDRAFT_199594 [Capitella teleta]